MGVAGESSAESGDGRLRVEGLTCLKAEAELPDRLLGDVTELEPSSLLVSSRSIGDLGRSRLLAGLEFCKAPRDAGDTAPGLVEEAAAMAAADEAADSSC